MRRGAGCPGPFFACLSHIFGHNLVTLSAPCGFSLNLPRIADRNLPTLRLGLRYRNVEFEHPILESSVCLINLSAFRQQYEPGEAPVGSLGEMHSTFLAGVFLVALTLDKQAF